jgi:hypothetical protein
VAAEPPANYIEQRACLGDRGEGPGGRGQRGIFAVGQCHVGRGGVELDLLDAGVARDSDDPGRLSSDASAICTSLASLRGRHVPHRSYAAVQGRGARSAGVCHQAGALSERASQGRSSIDGGVGRSNHDAGSDEGLELPVHVDLIGVAAADFLQLGHRTYRVKLAQPLASHPEMQSAASDSSETRSRIGSGIQFRRG